MSEQRYPVHVAENFLRWNLPANSKDIEARAQAVGIASTTLWRARRRLGVVVKDARFPGRSPPPPMTRASAPPAVFPVQRTILCDTDTGGLIGRRVTGYMPAASTRTRRREGGSD